MSPVPAGSQSRGVVRNPDPTEAGEITCDRLGWGTFLRKENDKVDSAK